MNVSKIKEIVTSAASWGAVKVDGYQPSKGGTKDLKLEVLPVSGYQILLLLTIQFLETLLGIEEHKTWPELDTLRPRPEFLPVAKELLEKYKARAAGRRPRCQTERCSTCTECWDVHLRCTPHKICSHIS